MVSFVGERGDLGTDLGDPWLQVGPCCGGVGCPLVDAIRFPSGSLLGQPNFPIAVEVGEPHL